MAVLLNQINVRTRRLALRPPRESDAERLYGLFNNWEVIRWLDSPPWPYAPEDARSFIDARKVPTAEFITAAIVLDDALIGMIDAIIKPASAIQRGRGYAIGYWIGQPYWGHGYMSEAARGFIAHVFATTPADTIFSGAFADNIASLRIQEKLDFARDGEAMSFSNPHGKDVLHVNTSLARGRFVASNTDQATG
jgi:RimJ/RimL family protein N-acetyltransferase